MINHETDYKQNVTFSMALKESINTVIRKNPKYAERIDSNKVLYIESYTKAFDEFCDYQVASAIATSIEYKTGILKFHIIAHTLSACDKEPELFELFDLCKEVEMNYDEETSGIQTSFNLGPIYK